MNTRQILLVVLAILLIGGLAVWWYFGFSLDFMRFFAAEPGVTDTTTRLCRAPAGCTCQVVQCVTTPCDPIIVCPSKLTPPPGCYYQEVQCIQAPCDPQLVCPSCQPRPACLDAKPSCDIAEPADGWCPQPGGRMVSCSPATQTVQVGAAAQLTAAGGDGNYQWYAPQGTINNFGTNGGAAVPGTASVVYDAAGTKKVTVQALRGDGSGNIDSVACTVVVSSVIR